MIENIRIALQSIRANLLRTILTIFVIGIGITALVGIQTAIESIKTSISENFTSMGANTFNIRNRSANIGKRGTKPKRYASISYTEAIAFKESFDFTTSVSSWASSTATITYASKKAIPTSILKVQTKTIYSPQVINFRKEETLQLQKSRKENILYSLGKK